MSTLQPFALLAGRLLLALIFIGSGFSKIGGFEATAASMASKGVPMVEVVGAILIELGGGLLLAAGYKARWAALAIFLFLIPVTLIFHAFWAVDPDQAKMQLIQFQKNLAIMGGMLYVVFNGPGAISVTGLTDSTSNQYGGKPSGRVATLTCYCWIRHCHGLSQTPVSA